MRTRIAIGIAIAVAIAETGLGMAPTSNPRADADRRGSARLAFRGRKAACRSQSGFTLRADAEPPVPARVAADRPGRARQLRARRGGGARARGRPGAGQNLYMSIDPTNRVWIREEPSYLPPVGSATSCAAEASAAWSPQRRRFPGGELVTGLLGWQDYVLVGRGRADARDAAAAGPRRAARVRCSGCSA